MDQQCLTPSDRVELNSEKEDYSPPLNYYLDALSNITICGGRRHRRRERLRMSSRKMENDDDELGLKAPVSTEIGDGRIVEQEYTPTVTISRTHILLF
jgi:hypothetical protein